MKNTTSLLILIALLLFSCKKNNPGPNEVFIQGKKFTPASITISAGSTITWTNKQIAKHTVTSDSSTFDSGDLGIDDTFNKTFLTPGSYSYHCKNHSGMTGTIIVQ